MKTNANNVLKVLILGVTILVTGGEILAASGTGGFGGTPTSVTCECIGGQGTPLIQTVFTGGVTWGNETGNLGVGATTPSQGGLGNVFGGSGITVNGGNPWQLQLGSTGQGGNPDGGGTITY
jgi:hypothetical protein